MGQGLDGGLIGFLQDFREHLGESARVGQGDGQQSGDGGEAQHLKEDQGPEQLMDGPHERARQPHEAKMKDYRQHK